MTCCRSPAGPVHILVAVLLLVCWNSKRHFERIWSFKQSGIGWHHGILKRYWNFLICQSFLCLCMFGKAYVRAQNIILLISIKSDYIVGCACCSRFLLLLIENILIPYRLMCAADPDDPYKLTDDTRQLGLVVCRGTSLTLICPADGFEQIANPFVQQE